MVLDMITCIISGNSYVCFKDKNHFLTVGYVYPYNISLSFFQEVGGEHMSVVMNVDLSTRPASV